PGEADTFFGSSSDEAKFARQYFQYVSPAPASKAQVLQFAPWASSARAATIIGGTHIGLVAIKLITAGKIKVELNGASYIATSINLSGAADLTAVATLVDSALDA